MTAIVSSKVPIEQLLPKITDVARTTNRDVAIEVGTMGRRANENTASRRMVVTLLTVFGSIALLLAALGTYGLLAYGGLTTQSRNGHSLRTRGDASGAHAIGVQWRGKDRVARCRCRGTRVRSRCHDSLCRSSWMSVRPINAPFSAALSLLS